jgi:hypothetical protein
MPSSPGPVGADIFSPTKKPSNGNKMAQSIKYTIFAFIVVVLVATTVVVWKLDMSKKGRRHKDLSPLATHHNASHTQGAALCLPD